MGVDDAMTINELDRQVGVLQGIINAGLDAYNDVCRERDARDSQIIMLKAEIKALEIELKTIRMNRQWPD